VSIKKIITLFALALLFAGVKGQTIVRNDVFKPGEQVTYNIYYHWHFVWVESGEVTFSVAERNYYNIPAYYLTGVGRSYPKYDWFYEVRDTFQAYVDTFSFRPMRFARYSNEGSNHLKNDNIFDYVNNKVYCYSGNKSGGNKRDSAAIPAGTFDPLTGIYFVRCLNFSHTQVNDTLPLILYLDAKVYHIRIKYLGKETETTQFGKFRCVKFNVSLIAGTMFKDGEEMTVWVTDDKNHVPVYIEAPIIVGSVRAELLSFSNLRNAMDAKVK